MTVFPPVAPAFSNAPLTFRQQQFQADLEGCLATLQENANRLFRDGYVAAPGVIPMVFVVSHDARGDDPRDGAACYYVHAVKRTCSCPFFTRQRKEPLTEFGQFVPCKHLLGLEKLVRQSANHFRQSDNLYPYLRLLSQWMAVLAEQHRLGFSTYTPVLPTIAAALPPEVQKGL